MKYSESKVSPNILKGLQEMGFDEMTPIQELAIPVMMVGRDVIGQAQTGTGKTAAFGIPMIENIDAKEKNIQGLVLCPTRELAIQAAEEISKMAKYVPGVKVVPVYGGQDITKQLRVLKGKVSIVVGTPGRVMDHMRRKSVNFDNLRMLVLDEADEMLNMGFREDIETICTQLPEDRQTALFSATMSPEILEITEQFQHDAKRLKVEEKELTIPLVKQSYYVIKGNKKDDYLCRLIDYMSPKKGLIFCNTKRKVDELTLMLKGKGYSAEALHGDLSQHQRDRVMNLFRNGRLSLLLATDVAARGIDVDDVDIVFNYDMPQDMEYYVHRIGRTGRAGKSGKAVSMIRAREKYKIDSLEEFCNTKIKKKEMPSAEDAMHVKAYRTLTEAVDYCKDMDMTPFLRIVYKRCIDDGMEPLDIAAAFLRMNLGDLEEIPEEKNHRRERSPHERNAHSEKNSGRKKDGKSKDNRSKGKKSKERLKGKKNGKRTKSSNKNRGHDKRRARSGKK